MLRASVAKRFSLPVSILYILFEFGEYITDLSIINYDTIIDHADFMDPFKPNEGIEAVFMMGQKVIERNEPTGKWLGRYLFADR